MKMVTSSVTKKGHLGIAVMTPGLATHLWSPVLACQHCMTMSSHLRYILLVNLP